MPILKWAFLEPFFDVSYALVNFGTLFFFGFLLLASGNAFWENAVRYRRRNLFLGCASFALLAFTWQFEDGIPRHFTEAGLKVLNLWAWIFVLFGYAARYLNRPSKVLAYCNRAVYPFYILHQTVTVILAYPLTTADWGFWAEAVYLTLGTFGISWLLYHFLIVPVPLLHPLFGLKPARKPQPPA